MRGRPGCIGRYMLLAHAQSRCVRIMRFCIMCVEVLVVRFVLYHVRCTICAVPFAPYHARCIMWCRRGDPLTQGRVRLTGRGPGQTSQRSSQSFGGQAVTSYVFLCFSALYSSHSCKFDERGTRARATKSQVRSQVSASVPSRIMAIRFGSTSFPPGCWDGDRPIGRRGSGAPFARGLARRGRRVGRSSVTHLLSVRLLLSTPWS